MCVFVATPNSAARSRRPSITWSAGIPALVEKPIAL
jgi:hypothetical protein